MNWIGWVILLLALWLAFKVAGVLLRVLLWVVVIACGSSRTEGVGWPSLRGCSSAG